jgi:signal transduction histidine kinase
MAALALGWAIAGARRAIGAHPRSELLLGTAYIVFGAGNVPLGLALTGSMRWAVVGAWLQLIAACVIAWIAVAAMMRLLRQDADRSLAIAGELADERVGQRRMIHEARNVISAVRVATEVLERNGESLDPVVQAQLRDSIGSEFNRLQQLLGPARGTKADERRQPW